MKITDQTFLNIWEILNQLISADVPSYVGSCRIAEVYVNSKKELEQFFKFRENLYKEYFDIDDKGIVQNIKNISKAEEFNTKLNELLSRERELNDSDFKIKLSYLKDIKLLIKNEKGIITDKISMPPMYHVVLKPFIENDITE
jgi:phage anti-repressor protein